MEHLEKLIPLAVLLGVAAFLLMLLRRATRETIVVEVAKEPEPIAVEPVPPPEAPVVIEPARVEIPVEAVAEVAPSPISEPLRSGPKKRVRPNKTPVQSVLAMLHDKDALAKAFLLREILGPPVSRRQ
jgi:hypothetical protein